MKMDPENSWLQQKVAAQKAALRLLNRRVVAQRAVLRKFAECGMVLSAEQWAELRAHGLDEEVMPDDVREAALASV